MPEIDVQDWCRNTEYTSGYDTQEPVIQVGPSATTQEPNPWTQDLSQPETPSHFRWVLCKELQKNSIMQNYKKITFEIPEKHWVCACDCTLNRVFPNFHQRISSPALISSHIKILLYNTWSWHGVYTSHVFVTLCLILNTALIIGKRLLHGSVGKDRVKFVIVSNMRMSFSCQLISFPPP